MIFPLYCYILIQKHDTTQSLRQINATEFSQEDSSKVSIWMAPSHLNEAVSEPDGIEFSLINCVNWSSFRPQNLTWDRYELRYLDWLSNFIFKVSTTWTLNSGQTCNFADSFFPDRPCASLPPPEICVTTLCQSSYSPQAHKSCTSLFTKVPKPGDVSLVWTDPASSVTCLLKNAVTLYPCIALFFF